MTSLALSVCTPVQMMYSSFQNGCSQWQRANGVTLCIWATCMLSAVSMLTQSFIAMLPFGSCHGGMVTRGLGVCTFITCQEVISDYLYIYIYIYIYYIYARGFKG